jgi:hypothetical protein
MSNKLANVFGWAVAISLGAYLGCLFTIVNSGSTELELQVRSTWIVIDLVVASVSALVALVIWIVYPMFSSERGDR